MLWARELVQRKNLNSTRIQKALSILQIEASKEKEEDEYLERKAPAINLKKDSIKVIEK